MDVAMATTYVLPFYLKKRMTANFKYGKAIIIGTQKEFGGLDVNQRFQIIFQNDDS